MDKKNVNSTLSAAFGLKPDKDEAKNDKTTPVDFNAAFGLQPGGQVPALEDDNQASDGTMNITMDFNSAFGLPQESSTSPKGPKNQNPADSALDVGAAFGLPLNKK